MPQLNIRLDSELFDKIKIYCESTHQSASDFARDAMVKALLGPAGQIKKELVERVLEAKSLGWTSLSEIEGDDEYEKARLCLIDMLIKKTRLLEVIERFDSLPIEMQKKLDGGKCDYKSLASTALSDLIFKESDLKSMMNAYNKKFGITFHKSGVITVDNA